MRHKILLFIFFILFGHLSLCYSLEKGTHSAINQHIAEHTVSGFSLDAYLKATLGFSKGKDELINRQKVYDWFKDGGKKEDEPMYTRSLNHFHNPLKEPWSSAGLKGTSKSSILWAHDQGLAGFLTGGNFAWKNVREYFYTALTGKDFSGTWIAYSQAEKEIYYGATFRGIGQLMHLVEDASVPAHTRDDAHVIGYHYELAVDKFRTSNDPQEKIIFDNAIANPITFDPSILALPPNSLAPIPISKIFDTDKYNNPNPDPNVTYSNAIGLSEYSNANFVSEGVLAANFQDFPYPRIQDTTIIGKTYVSLLGTYTRQYYLKNCCGETNNGNGYLLAAVDYFDYWRQKYPLLSVGLPKIPVLDDNVYKDYASLLIPRAVGYSAGLLDYFFRGDLYVTLLVPSTDYVGFDFHNQNDTGSNIDTVAVFIQNNSKLNNVIEPIGTGTLTLTVSYKDFSGTTFYEPAINSISVTQIPDMGSASYFAALFTLTQPISTQTAQDITYYFAFRGQLGNETDAVIGKVVKGPVLYNVVPDNGLEGDIVTLTGNNLPIINGPFPIILDDNVSDVRFNHDLTPYTTEVINRTNTDITVKVPNTASLKKPGYGGLRVRNVLDTGEKIYSNPISFFPIAEGEVRNTGQTIVNVTIEATKPIVGDYSPLPQTITINNLSPGVSAPIQLITGFTYKATANTTVTKDIYLLTSNPVDFIFEVQ